MVGGWVYGSGWFGFCFSCCCRRWLGLLCGVWWRSDVAGVVFGWFALVWLGVRVSFAVLWLWLG